MQQFAPPKKKTLCVFAENFTFYRVFFFPDLFFTEFFFPTGFFLHRNFFPRSAKFCWGAEPSCDIMSQTFLLDATFPDLRATKCRNAMLTFFPGGKSSLIFYSRVEKSIFSFQYVSSPAI
jgi:hypothetical protein